MDETQQTSEVDKPFETIEAAGSEAIASAQRVVDRDINYNFLHNPRSEEIREFETDDQRYIGINLEKGDNGDDYKVTRVQVGLEPRQENNTMLYPQIIIDTKAGALGSTPYTEISYLTLNEDGYRVEVGPKFNTEQGFSPKSFPQEDTEDTVEDPEELSERMLKDLATARETLDWLSEQR